MPGGRRHQRSDEATEYRKLYKLAAWRRLRIVQLTSQPLCDRCERQGKTVAATVVNHVQPHKGDKARFFDPANLQSLCAPCHDGAVQSEERRGYSTETGPDGYPADPRHPFNTGKV